jgi:hypothetical protein
VVVGCVVEEVHLVACGGHHWSILTLHLLHCVPVRVSKTSCGSDSHFLLPYKTTV